jgi:hypothetical protein
MDFQKRYGSFVFIDDFVEETVKEILKYGSFIFIDDFVEETVKENG